MGDNTEDPRCSKAEFEKIWPVLRKAVEELLQQLPGHYPTVSYEKHFSLVYRCVLSGFGWELHNRTSVVISDHLQCNSSTLSKTSDDELIDSFDLCSQQFFEAVSGIVAIFAHLDRFLQSKSEEGMKKDLYLMFDSLVAEPNVERLISCLRRAKDDFLSVPPSQMERIVTLLYKLDTAYASLCPELFRRFIPAVELPVPLLEAEVEWNNLGFVNTADSESKRSFEDPVDPSPSRSAKRFCADF
ncbi:unnamed protein product [Soboliphyme baturini]|uniref:Cullin domain-containing protein n=1 Tax=Soboliphyme baturini TaxID=241478 RepID=A0A183II01_9BILA|nr:unnamed protein product [Soboliphyme baturini]